MTKNNSGEDRICLDCTSMAQSVSDRNQGKNSIKKLEVGDDTEAMDKHCLWLASPGFLSCLSYTIHPKMPKDRNRHNELGPPH